MASADLLAGWRTSRNSIIQHIVRWRLSVTSGLPGRRRVTPRACGDRRRSIHPLHRAPIARHCCPTRAGPVPFLKVAPQAKWTQEHKSVWDGPASKATSHDPRPARDWPVPLSYRRPVQAIAHTSARGPRGPSQNRPFCNFSPIFTH